MASLLRAGARRLLQAAAIAPAATSATCRFARAPCAAAGTWLTRARPRSSTRPSAAVLAAQSRLISTLYLCYTPGQELYESFLKDLEKAKQAGGMPKPAA